MAKLKRKDIDQSTFDKWAKKVAKATAWAKQVKENLPKPKGKTSTIVYRINEFILNNYFKVEPKIEAKAEQKDKPTGVQVLSWADLIVKISDADNNKTVSFIDYISSSEGK